MTMEPCAVKGILDCLPERLRHFLVRQPCFQQQEISELRLRAEYPLHIRFGQGDLVYDGITEERFICLYSELERFLRAALQNSYYAMEDMLSEGYFTLSGGHRVGLTGRAIVKEGRISGFTAIRSVNIRFARYHALSQLDVLPLLSDEQKLLYSTILIGPPLSGKTTLLRTLMQFASCGKGGLKPMQTGVVDEKSELAGLNGVVPSFAIGIRTDVIDGCPKSDGMIRLIRNMSPQLLVTDEIGRPADAAALNEAVRCGVRVLTSAHGASLTELRQRPLFQGILKSGGFQRAVVLGNDPYIGSISCVYDLEKNVRLR